MELKFAGLIKSINMAQVQALSIAEIIAHTKQQPLPKLNIFQSSHQVEENFRYSVRWDIIRQ
jgi:hypothetical protein